MNENNKVFFARIFAVFGLFILAVCGFQGYRAYAYQSMQARLTENAATNQRPYVVELFTSQSCSSCPPADELLADLAMHDNVIALSCHVTYWNHLQWRDTYSRDICNERQAAYQASFKKRGVFTPQMVINGHYSAVGSRPTDVNDALMRASEADIRPATIAIRAKNAMDYELMLPALDRKVIAAQPKHDLALYAFTVRKNDTQGISSGENAGRILPTTNAVLAVDVLEPWDGYADIRSITLSKPVGENEFLILVAQRDKGHPILAAGISM